MTMISDISHINKLREKDINIKTKYIVGHDILERNSDNSSNDDIDKGIILEKEYYYKNKLVHKENIFDSRMEYSFISKNLENTDYRCPNCGMESKLKDIKDGCPYCGTYYNIDYYDKDLGSKYHYDLVLRNNTYRIITGIVDLIISIILCFIFIKLTSRTFNSYDIAKVFIYGIILSLILYYFFYIIDGYVILGPIKRYKERLNKEQMEFWNRTKIDKKKFYNNFNYELRNKYYKDGNIIDYDIIDYIDFKEYTKNDKYYVKVKVDIRIVYFNNGKINSRYSKEEYILRRNSNDTIELKGGTNIIQCHNCGSSIDVRDNKCNYCGSEIKYLQEWIME